MFKERDDRSIGKLSQWCVGEEPKTWDVSFGARLAEQLRRWLRLSAPATESGQSLRARHTAAIRKAA